MARMCNHAWVPYSEFGCAVYTCSECGAVGEKKFRKGALPQMKISVYRLEQISLSGKIHVNGDGRVLPALPAE